MYDYIPDEPVYRVIDEPVTSAFNSSFYEITDEPIYRDIDRPSTPVISGSNPFDEIANPDYGISAKLYDNST